VGRPGRWILGLLGSTLLGFILNVPVAIVVGWAVGLIGKAHHAGPVWVIVPAVAAGVFVFAVLSIVYAVKVGPWLATLGPPQVSLRPLADRAENHADLIMRFEHRDPDGAPIPIEQRPLSDVLNELSDPQRSSDSWTRFEREYGQNLRNLFHDLQREGLVEKGELSLFYSPRTPDNRVALAFRLRQAALRARNRD
jgi:hypothetical protein